MIVLMDGSATLELWKLRESSSAVHHLVDSVGLQPVLQEGFEELVTPGIVFILIETVMHFTSFRTFCTLLLIFSWRVDSLGVLCMRGLKVRGLREMIIICSCIEGGVTSLGIWKVFLCRNFVQKVLVEIMQIWMSMQIDGHAIVTLLSFTEL